MKIISLFACVLLLSACTTLSSIKKMQNECYNENKSFPRAVNCLERKYNDVSSSVLNRQENFINAYMLIGKKLAKDVKSNKIDSDDAKLKWEMAYIKLQNEDDKKIDSALNNMQRQQNFDTYINSLNRPQMATCTSTSNTVHCMGY